MKRDESSAKRKRGSVIFRSSFLPLLLLGLALLMSGGPRTVIVLLFSPQPYGASVTLPIANAPSDLSEAYGRVAMEQSKADFSNDRFFLWLGGSIGCVTYLLSVALASIRIFQADTSSVRVLPIVTLVLAVAIAIWAIGERGGQVDLSRSSWF